MASIAPATGGHGQLMDNVYRWQRHIYDATRKYFLFGRDRLIAGLDLAEGGTLLELGCGTGRNLDLAARHWPAASLHGLDISAEMLKSAEAKLGARAQLAEGDACAVEADALFGRARFDRVMISFALSMIPAWEAALAEGLRLLAPGGSLHIVDFGDAAGLPAPLRALLNGWLARFHVSPRLTLADRATALAATGRFKVRTRRGPFGYYQLIVLTRRS
ncbi:MAG TPA: class I SAM-dependent methyltransferase [Novosphingobium sp.]|nr:class I SAM-dependent methyltransferase [Novosphingobium sp.]